MASALHNNMKQVSTFGYQTFHGCKLNAVRTALTGAIVRKDKVVAGTMVMEWLQFANSIERLRRDMLQELHDCINVETTSVSLVAYKQPHVLVTVQQLFQEWQRQQCTLQTGYLVHQAVMLLCESEHGPVTQCAQAYYETAMYTIPPRRTAPPTVPLEVSEIQRMSRGAVLYNDTPDSIEWFGQFLHHLHHNSLDCIYWALKVARLSFQGVKGAARNQRNIPELLVWNELVHRSQFFMQKESGPRVVPSIVSTLRARYINRRHRESSYGTALIIQAILTVVYHRDVCWDRYLVLDTYRTYSTVWTPGAWNEAVYAFQQLSSIELPEYAAKYHQPRQCRPPVERPLLGVHGMEMDHVPVPEWSDLYLALFALIPHVQQLHVDQHSVPKKKNKRKLNTSEPVDADQISQEVSVAQDHHYYIHKYLPNTLDLSGHLVHVEKQYSVLTHLPSGNKRPCFLVHGHLAKRPTTTIRLFVRTDCRANQTPEQAYGYQVAVDRAKKWFGLRRMYCQISGRYMVADDISSWSTTLQYPTCPHERLKRVQVLNRTVIGADTASQSLLHTEDWTPSLCWQLLAIISFRFLCNVGDTTLLNILYLTQNQDTETEQQLVSIDEYRPKDMDGSEKEQYATAQHILFQYWFSARPKQHVMDQLWHVWTDVTQAGQMNLLVERMVHGVQLANQQVVHTFDEQMVLDYMNLRLPIMLHILCSINKPQVGESKVEQQVM